MILTTIGKLDDPLSLPGGLHERCTEALGSAFAVISRHDHDHGEASVWQLATQDGTSFYLKRHRQTGKWLSETHAYERWVPASFGNNAPRLIAAFDGEAQSLLLTVQPGVIMERLTLSPEQQQAAWKAAGKALARLHNLATNAWFGACRRDGSPQGDKEPPHDAAAFVAASIASNLARAMAANALAADDAAFVAAIAPEWTAALEGEPPMPVHRDYSPRNWLCDPESGTWTGAIDFEHSRWDVRAADMQRGWDREWLGRPDLKAAFFDGYLGGPPDDRLTAQVRALRLLNAVGGIRWSIEHGDEKFEAENRANLARLREEASL